MSNPRYDLILASSALALVLAVPLSGLASGPKLVAAPIAVTPAEQISTQSPAAVAIAPPANEPSANAADRDRSRRRA